MRDSTSNLDFLMDRLQLTARQLSAVSGIDQSLITKWRRGDRRLSTRSASLRPLASSLISLDAEGIIEKLLRNLNYGADSTEGELSLWLCDENVIDYIPPSSPPEKILSGEYVVTAKVYLGRRGFRRAVIDMLDYTSTLPPGREITVLCNGNFSWIADDEEFLQTLLSRNRYALGRGTKVTLINRKGFSVGKIPHFSGPWMMLHTSGIVNSLCYESAASPDISIIIAVEGYVSIRMGYDEEVEDGLYTTMRTDPVAVKENFEQCLKYREISSPLCKHGVLRNLAWEPFPPHSGICAITATPGPVFIDRLDISGDTSAAPDFLFSPASLSPAGPVKLILNKTAVAGALGKKRYRHNAMSAVLGREVFISRDNLIRQLRSIFDAVMRGFCELALVPGVAFERIGMEFVAWLGGAALAWRAPPGQSLYTTNEDMSGALITYHNYAWDSLMLGWKNRRFVLPTLRKWLRGDAGNNKDLTSRTKNWSVIPGTW